MKVKKGDTVKISYKGTLDDGTVFDSSEAHGQPLTFTIGTGQVIPGFEDALIGMEKGEEKDITIEAKDAYGDAKPEFIKSVPKDRLPPEVEVGSMLAMNLPNGGQMPAKVVEVTETEVKIDLNHPLAGKTLHFKLKVEEITS